MESLHSPLSQAEVDRIIDNDVTSEFERLRGVPGYCLDAMSMGKAKELISDGSAECLGQMGRHPSATVVYHKFRRQVYSLYEDSPTNVDQILEMLSCLSIACTKHTWHHYRLQGLQSSLCSSENMFANTVYKFGPFLVKASLLLLPGHLASHLDSFVNVRLLSPELCMKVLQEYGGMVDYVKISVVDAPYKLNKGQSWSSTSIEEVYSF